jgi:hypothetical protein
MTDIIEFVSRLLPTHAKVPSNMKSGAAEISGISNPESTK